MLVPLVFKNGPSTQAVRIPKEHRFTSKEVWIEKAGEALIIRPKADSWDDFFYGSLTLSDDFSMERNQKLPQDRDDLLL